MDFGKALASVEAQSNDFDVLPAGEYEVQCLEAGVRPTKDGTGKYINAQFSVVNHDRFNNRRIFNIFNVQNKSEKATQIGMSQLKSFFMASGILPATLETKKTYEEVASLMNGLKCLVKLKIESNSQYGDKNRVTSFKPSTPEGMKAMSAPISDPAGANAGAPW